MSTSFDSIGDQYDRYRPVYPEPLFDDLFSLSGARAGSRVLEIGSGTGIATLPVAQRGCDLVCLEPGARLAEIARRKLDDARNVRIIQETFESWDPQGETFDLVYSAQAFHWIDPEVRYSKTASILAPGGALAVFGNATIADASPIGRALQEVYARHAANLAGPSLTQWYLLDGPLVGLFEESGLFGDVETRRHRWSRIYPKAQYLNLLQTISSHSTLPEMQRERVFLALSEVIDAFGGEIEVAYESNLFVANRIA